MKKLFLVLFLSIAAAFGVVGAARAEIQIVAIGDSNIEGRGVSSADAYPAQLERALRAKGYDVRVANRGITGDTAQGVLSRLDAAVPNGTQVAIVWVGINDIRQGVDPESTRQAIAARLRARGIQVVLLGPRHGLREKPEYLIGDKQGHLNPAGYAQVVARTLPQVVAAIGRAKRR